MIQFNCRSYHFRFGLTHELRGEGRHTFICRGEPFSLFSLAKSRSLCRALILMREQPSRGRPLFINPHKNKPFLELDKNWDCEGVWVGPGYLAAAAKGTGKLISEKLNGKREMLSHLITTWGAARSRQKVVEVERRRRRRWSIKGGDAPDKQMLM